MTFLSMLGLMKVEDHTKSIADRLSIIRERDDARRALVNAQTKFNKAVVDMAAQSDELEGLKFDLESARNSADRDDDTITGLRAQLSAAEEVIAELKPDALAMRKKRQGDIDRAQAKRDAAKVGAANDAAPKAKKGGRS